MKKLTANERVIFGKLWDTGHSITATAIVIDCKRRDMDMHYLVEQVAEEMSSRVGIAGEGTE